ncbi:type II toxin-antitoxin system VapC family toxin [Aquamicrobium lusatiense]|jgi:ribonuclease VapC|uniref:type II toxin-antitoxin system VapC family toxin n=1 Tax=Aquamicrobium lusatiense TaxID=89772 RepID=UPI002458A5E2|nr:type II toxin-antitoxin system VapC family toxin [Aquamicrobium lusatiense]MDH4990515.1 type II toxin-antitoxin system VapC family toxin [Aquamicrobium lusatiense]
MYIDASAMVAILAPEEDGSLFAARLEAAQHPFTSAISIFETVLALGRLKRVPISEALYSVHAFVERAGMEIISVPHDRYVSALKAHARYGKGTGSHAGLNMGDCFAYAMAQRYGVPLLYKGNDFSFTDLR